MEFLFKDDAENDLVYWHKNSKAIIKRIELLLKSMKATPFSGIGKPEALKENLYLCDRKQRYQSRYAEYRCCELLSKFVPLRP